jgi:O-antigen/teichoic acid export membrane protein
MPDQDQSLRRSGSRAFIFTGLGLVCNLVSGILTARALSPSGRGALAAIIVAPGIATWVFGMGAEQANAYARARDPKLGPTLLTTWTLLTVPLTLVATLTVELALPLLLHAQSAHVLFLARLFAPCVGLSILSQLMIGALLGSHDYRMYNISKLLQWAVLTVIVAILYIANALTVESALLATIASLATPIVLAVWRVITRLGGYGQPSWSKTKPSFIYGVKAHGSNFGLIVNARLDLLIMPAFLGATSVGLYTVGTNISWIIVLLAGAIAPIVLPAATVRGEQGSKAVVNALHATFAIGMTLAIGMLIFARPVLGLVYGHEFRAGATALILLLPGCVLFACAQVLWSGLNAANRPLMSAATQVPGIVITVVGLSLLLRKDGINAAAIVSSTAYATVFLSALFAYKQVLNLSLRDFFHFDEAFASLVRTPAKADRRIQVKRFLRSAGMRSLIVVALSFIAIGIGLVVVFAGNIIDILKPTTWGIATVFTAILIGTYSARQTLASLRHDHRLRFFGSLLISAAVLLTIAIPGLQLSTGARISKLAVLGASVPTQETPTSIAFALSILALVAFFVGELLVATLRQPGDQATLVNLKSWGNKSRVIDREIYIALAIVGLVALLTTHSASQETFVTRGEIRGEGIVDLALKAGWVAVALGILRSHWNSKVLASFSGILTILIVAQGVRTPMLIIGAAMAIRFLTQIAKSKRRWPSVAGGILLVYAGLVLAVSLSQWRGEIRDGKSPSLLNVVAESSGDPISRLTPGGLDTFDGLILAQSVDGQALGIKWTDPEKAFTSFVPYSLWPTKPEFFSPIVTHAYTQVGGKGGIFFSGPGYAYIVYRGTIGVVFVFLFLGILSGFVFRRARIDSIFTAIWAYFFFRFFMAGDAFDAFHAMGLALVVLIAYVGVSLSKWALGNLRSPTAPAKREYVSP